MDEGNRGEFVAGFSAEAGDGGEWDADAAGLPPATGPEPGASRTDAPPPSRHAPRLSFEAVVRISCAGRRGIHTGFVRDISRGGMFLRLVDPEPVGRRLGFELFLPGWRMPARGVGEVAWNRASYEGPGRPPGMAIRFVALEARAIEMLAAVLPNGEAPVVEVLEPRRLPPVRRDDELERGARAANLGADAASVPILPAEGSPGVDSSLEELLAASGVASMSLSAEIEPQLAAELGDDGPMIFVPPPPLPEPVLPPGPPVRAFVEPVTPPSRQRWGSAAAGIAAFGAIASLIVVGAARRDVLPTENSGPTRPAVQRPAPHDASAVPPGAAAVSTVPAARSAVDTTVGGAAGALPASIPVPDSAQAAAATATRVTALRWEPLPAGGTRVMIALDGAFAAARLRASRIGGEAPRLVVRLLGLGEGPRGPWEPSTAQVRRIRAGRHDGEAGAELHLVLDLGSAGVRLARSTVVGNELQLDLM